MMINLRLITNNFVKDIYLFSIFILSNVKHRLHVWARVYRGSLNGGLLLNLAEAEEEAGPVVGIVDDIREC